MDKGHVVGRGCRDPDFPPSWLPPHCPPLSLLLQPHRAAPCTSSTHGSICHPHGKEKPPTGATGRAVTPTIPSVAGKGSGQGTPTDSSLFSRSPRLPPRQDGSGGRLSTEPETQVLVTLSLSSAWQARRTAGACRSFLAARVRVKTRRSVHSVCPWLLGWRLRQDSAGQPGGLGCPRQGSRAGRSRTGAGTTCPGYRRG